MVIDPTILTSLGSICCPGWLILLAINETHLDSSIQNGETSIPGYTLERKDRNRSGGGMALDVQDSINFKRLNDLPEAHMELISIQVSKPRVELFIVHLVSTSWIHHRHDGYFCSFIFANVGLISNRSRCYW